MIEHVLTGRHLVDGAWMPTAAGQARAVSPASGEPLDPPFHEAGPGEVEEALRAADSAFAQTRDLPREGRADLLEAIAGSILDLGDALLERGRAETGLPRPRLEAERGRTMGQLRLFAGLVREGSWVDAVIDTADPSRSPIPRPDVRRMLRPIGPVAVFGAGNFPYAFGACGGDTASALAAGNPVVVKGHPGHPGTSELFAAAVRAAIEACRLPQGLFGLLQGGTAAGLALAGHPSIRAVAFTGSKTAGRALFDLAASRRSPIPVYAEMGSINPLVVLPGALAERGGKIAEGLAQSVTLGVGQFCTKPGVVFLLEGPGAQGLLEDLARRLAGTAPGTMLGARSRGGFCEAAARMARTPGVRRRLAGNAPGFADMAPHLFETDAGTWRREPHLREEAFGPATLVVLCRDLQDLLGALEDSGGNLTATVHKGTADGAGDVRSVMDILERISGRVIVDGFPTGVEVCRAMVHGGPYPATTAPATTSVGTLAILRFVRPVCFQNVPDGHLPPALQDANPLGLLRTIDGESARAPVHPRQA